MEQPIETDFRTDAGAFVRALHRIFFGRTRVDVSAGYEDGAEVLCLPASTGCLGRRCILGVDGESPAFRTDRIRRSDEISDVHVYPMGEVSLVELRSRRNGMLYAEREPDGRFHVVTTRPTREKPKRRRHVGHVPSRARSGMVLPDFCGGSSRYT